MKHSSFTYRNEDRVLSFCFHEDTLVVSLPAKLVVWDRGGRRVIKELEMKNEIVDIKYWDGAWALFSKNSIEVVVDDEVQEIGGRSSLSTSVVCEDCLLVVDDKELMVVRAGGVEVRKVGLVSGNGICSCGLFMSGELFLSFENGKIFRIERSLVKRVASGQVGEIDMSGCDCLIFLKEPIMDIGILGERMVVSLFSGKIVVLGLDDIRDTVFTELPHDIRRSFVWGDVVVVEDRENNIVFLDSDLRIINHYGFNEEVCKTLANSSVFMVGFREGMIREYSGIGVVDSLIHGR